MRPPQRIATKVPWVSGSRTFAGSFWGGAAVPLIGGTCFARNRALRPMREGRPVGRILRAFSPSICINFHRDNGDPSAVRQHIQKQYPDFAREQIEFLIDCIDMGYPREHCSQAQLLQPWLSRVWLRSGGTPARCNVITCHARLRLSSRTKDYLSSLGHWGRLASFLRSRRP